MIDPQPTTISQPKRRRTSVSARIVFLVFLCTFCTALALTWISLQTTHTHLRAQIDRSFPAVLARSKAELQPWLARGIADLTSLAGVPQDMQLLERAARGRTHDLKRLTTTLERFLDRAGQFDGLALLAEDGTWVAGTGIAAPSPEPLPVGAHRIARLAAVELETGLAAMAFLPIGRGDAIRGWLAARYDVQLLDALLTAELNEVPGTVFLSTRDSYVLAAAGATPTGHPTLARMLQQTEDGETSRIHQYVSDLGVRTLGALEPLDADLHSDWLLVIEAPYKTAFAPILSVATRIFAIDLVIILIFTTVAYRIATRMMGPIAALSEGARRASQGDLEHEIADPGTQDEIALLTHAFNEMMRRLRHSQLELQRANGQLTGRNDELQRANEVLSQLSITDGLTKLHNHRHFQEELTREIKRQGRTRDPLSMLLVDLDDFKQLNDRLGHASGDELLSRVAAILGETVRESDLLARYGGEEFVVLASNTDLAGAVQLAEKLRMAVEESTHVLDSLRPVRMTVSIGVAQYAGNRGRFFESTDRALYRAKDEGKNCVIAAEDESLVAG